MVRRRSTFNVPTFNGYHQPMKSCACNATFPIMIVNRQCSPRCLLPPAFCFLVYERLPCSRAQRCPPAPFPLPSAFCLLVFHISQFAIRNSQCFSSCLLPSVLPLLPCSRAQRCSPAPLHLCTPAQTSPPASLFTFHGVIPQFAIRNSPCLFPCSLAPERSGAPLHPFRCLLPTEAL